MKPSTSASMRDVATRAGVTAATVSLCLKGSPDVRPETRVKIMEAVSALGYRKNPFVSALMKSRRHRGPAPGGPTLAFLTAFPTRDGWRKVTTPVFRQMFDGALIRARQCGY